MILFPEFLPADWVGNIGWCRLCRYNVEGYDKVTPGVCKSCAKVFHRWFLHHYCDELGRREAGKAPARDAPFPDEDKEKRFLELEEKFDNGPTTKAEEDEYWELRWERPHGAWSSEAGSFARLIKSKGPQPEHFSEWIKRQLDRVVLKHKRRGKSHRTRTHMPEDLQ